MTLDLAGFTPYAPQDAARYERQRWWAGLTLADLVDKAAAVYPDREGFVDGRSRLTFGEAKRRVDRLAAGFRDLGLRAPDRVLVQLPNWNEFVLAYFALQKLGAVPVLLLERYKQHEINHLVRLTGATAWIVPETHGKTDYLPIVRDVRADNPSLAHVVLARGTAGGEFPTLESLGAAEPSEAALRALREGSPHPGQVAHMAPTGGTTGLPKVVPRTHDSLLCGAEYAARAWDYDGRDTCLLAGPIGHDLSFTKGLLSGLFVYARLVLLDTNEMAAVCRTIEGERVTALVWVPTLARRLVQYEHLADYNLSSLEKMHSGGGASLPDLIRGVREKLGCTYYNGYGGTEGQTTITRTGDDLETVCTTVGKPTCPHDLYRIVDPSSGEVLPPGASGELVIKGPGVFTGYYGNPEENTAAFTPDGFFRTGDLATIDEKGYVTLTGRAKEMINRGGESISSLEIEKLVSDHPDVLTVAVVPMPDPELGERACAYVQVRAGVQLTFADVIAYLKGRKAAVLHLPERIEFVLELPQTKAGKIDKKALRDDITAKLAG